MLFKVQNHKHLSALISCGHLWKLGSTTVPLVWTYMYLNMFSQNNFLIVFHGMCRLKKAEVYSRRFYWNKCPSVILYVFNVFLATDGWVKRRLWEIFIQCFLYYYRFMLSLCFLQTYCFMSVLLSVTFDLNWICC